jgi:hypothetical protein
MKVTAFIGSRRGGHSYIASMTLFGCGPKLALLCLPYIILSLVVMYLYPEFFDLKFLDNIYVRALGYIWLAVGIVFWIYSAAYYENID